MRKGLIKALGIIALTGGVLAGCGEEKASTESKEKATPAEQKEVSNKPSKPKKDENGNVILDQVGQKTKDADGTEAELMKIKAVNQTIDIAPIKFTVKDMKIIKLSNVSKDFEQFLVQYTGGTEIPDGIQYLQFKYSVENTSDSNIQFNGIDKVVLNNGEQLDALNGDFIWEKEDSDSDFFGKVKKEGTVGLFIKGKAEDISSVKLIMSDTINPDTYDTITEAQQAEFQF
ncbi:hypothetical protein OH784_12315 [Ectobacillus funiculus]|uniref:hypothetical protein n=1 Tax=Ectobacillus funiculus TaxID=137993 RepID=UPI00397CF90D